MARRFYLQRPVIAGEGALDPAQFKAIVASASHSPLWIPSLHLDFMVMPKSTVEYARARGRQPATLTRQELAMTSYNGMPATKLQAVPAQAQSISIFGNTFCHLYLENDDLLAERNTGLMAVCSAAESEPFQPHETISIALGRFATGTNATLKYSVAERLVDKLEGAWLQLGEVAMMTDNLRNSGYSPPKVVPFPPSET